MDAARRSIVAWALAQGAGLWALHGLRATLQPALLWPLYVLVLALPLTLQMLAAHRARRLLWALAGALCLVLMAAAAHAGHQAVGEHRGAVLALLVVLLAACWFVLLPFAAQRLALGSWARDYAHLFASAWRHAFQLQVAALFTGLFWALLMLLAGLFKVLGVALFMALFTRQPFIYLATPLAFGLGLSLYATREDALAGFWRALLQVLGWLLPLACLIALLFLLALPVRGLAPLWRTGHATALMLGLMAWTVFLFNVAWSDGAPEAQRFGPRLCRFIGAGLLALPAYAALCAYALGLRVAQHGWSVDRVWAALAVALMSVYALGYAAAVLRRGAPWMALARHVNVAAALLAVALALLTCTPLLQPARIAVSSQLARLQAQRVQADAFDYAYLRWEAGRAGLQALERLSAEDSHPQAAAVRQHASAALQARVRNPGARARHGAPAAWTPETLRARLLPHPPGAPLDAQWLAFMLAQVQNESLPLLACSETAPCPVLAIDLDGDGQAEQVLLSGHGSRVFTRDGGQWRDAGRLQGRRIGQLRGGPGAGWMDRAVQTQKPRWRDLLIGGERYTVRERD